MTNAEDHTSPTSPASPASPASPDASLAISGGWTVVDQIDSVGALHGTAIPEAVSREVWFMVPTAPALVLGSSQSNDEVDSGAMRDAGLELAKRRSGGGAVLVDASSLWVDLFIGRDDPLWDDDVGRAFGWVGELWLRTLRRLANETQAPPFDAGELQVHQGVLERNEWNRRVCFASVGPGEVTLGGRKVVGISQRRTREACRFQCSVLLEDRQRLVPSLLALSADERTAARGQVEASATGLGVSAVTVRRVLLAELDQATPSGVAGVDSPS